MFTTAEPFATAARAKLDAQIDIMSTLTNKAFENVEKVVDLNMSIVKASLEESMITAKQLLAIKSPQAFFSIASAQTQPAAQKALAYGRHMMEIVSNTQAEFRKAAEKTIDHARE